MKRIIRLLGSLLLLLIITVSCSKDSYEPKTTPSTNPSTNTEETSTISAEIQKADEFAQASLSIYYLWNNEIASSIQNKLDPSTCTDPITTVESIRYKQGGGYNSKQDEDRWTQLFEDITPFKESVEGVSTTNGMSLSVGSFNGSSPQSYFLIVNLVYENSPAAQAGIKRGDIIISYNGADITEANLEDAYYGETSGDYGFGIWKTDGIHDAEKTITLNSVKMYLNPIICNKTFDVNGKKVGYLMYDNFDLDSCEKLIEVCKQFKSEGVKELILDLRYNGGGYVFTENLLASMLAPEANVAAGDLYQQEIFNEVLTEAFSEDAGDDFNKTFFSFTHEMGKKGEDDYVSYSTAGANIGLDKIYAIVDGNTASASESLLVGLSPFVDIVTIGEQTYGKYCTGYILGTSDVYKTSPEIIKNWGIYVMVSTYADRDNENMARPIGILPDIITSDSPWDAYDIGDENEAMLKAALTTAGKPSAVAVNTRALTTMPDIKIKSMHNKYRFGKRILMVPEEIKEEVLR